MPSLEVCIPYSLSKRVDSGKRFTNLTMASLARCTLSKQKYDDVVDTVEENDVDKEYKKLLIAKMKDEAEARQNQPKQVLHTASCYSPYIPDYVGNSQPTASIASASHSQASWA